MLKDILSSIFENVYNPEIDPQQYIEKFVSRDYKQTVDGHKLNYDDFIQHINKQRQVVKDVRFEYIFLAEEENVVASLHRVYATKIASNQPLIAEVHAFFEFADGKLILCDERTRIIQGSKEDQDLGRRK